MSFLLDWSFLFFFVGGVEVTDKYFKGFRNLKVTEEEYSPNE